LSIDLPINKLKAVPCIGNLLAKAGGKLREKIAVFACCGLGIEIQLGGLA
jgi:hypothetical protein